jgi:type IV secretory pathway VirB6-like protein
MYFKFQINQKLLFYNLLGCLTKTCRLFYLFLSLVIFSYLLIINPAQAEYQIPGVGYQGVRKVDWDKRNQKCESNDFKVEKDRGDAKGLSVDDEFWDFSNASCLLYTAGVGAEYMGVSIAASYACGTTYSPSPILTIIQALLPVANTLRCATLAASLNPATAVAASACCVATTAQFASYGIAQLALERIYNSANHIYKTARICGHDWQIWSKTNNKGEAIKDSLGNDLWSRGSYSSSGSKGAYSKCINDLFENINSCNLKAKYKSASVTSKSMFNLYYREYIYGGKEYEDHGVSACNLPQSWDSQTRNRILGYNQGKQRYYMRGSGLAANYACNRFLVEGTTDPSVRKAYNCCKQRSQNTICIETGKDKFAFCEPGKSCSVDGFSFQSYLSIDHENYICAKTSSVCPYNHLLGGGTETEDYSNIATPHIRQNFCQYMNHCVKIPNIPYITTEAKFSHQLISPSCKNLRGDSQNTYSYIIGNSKNQIFSASIVQCFKETLENLLLNTTNTALDCLDFKEKKDEKGNCPSGKYKDKEKTNLDSPSFLLKIQDKLRSAIKMALVLSVMWFGTTILMGLGHFKRKELMLFIVKIGLVMYFALGTAWQSGFMSGLINSSNMLAQITMQISPANDDSKLQDGCQFPKFNYLDISDDNAKKAYPPGKEYLKIWDTLDCKIARALGFAPQASVPNLIWMILAGFLTAGAGIIFVVATLCFAFFLIAMVVRAVHIFLISSLAIMTLIYISPITITMALFKQTKSLFDGWWRQLLGVCLQPMVLFAYLGIVISIFDAVIVGPVTFLGDGKNAPKEINCSQNNAASNSVYCIFNTLKMKNYNGLEPIGIGLPMLYDDNLPAKVSSLIKAALLMFVLTQFLNKIQELAMHLVGGPLLDANWGSTVKMTKKTYRSLQAIQKRAHRAIIKHGKKIAKSTGKYTKHVINKAGDKKKRTPHYNHQKADKIIGNNTRNDKTSH